MKSFAERLEVIGGAETRVESTRVIDPVTVIRIVVGGIAVNVLTNGRNPNSVKTHVRNIIKLVNDRQPCSATPCLVDGITFIRYRGGPSGRSVGDWSESIGEKLVNGFAFPLVGRSCTYDADRHEGRKQ